MARLDRRASGPVRRRGRRDPPSRPTNSLSSPRKPWHAVTPTTDIDDASPAAARARRLDRPGPPRRGHRPRARRGRRAEGRQRPPRHRDEPRPAGLHAVPARHAPRPEPTRTGSAATGSCSPAGHSSLTLYIQLYLSGYGLELVRPRGAAHLGLADPGPPRAPAHPRASRSPPARWARASPPRSAWRWPRAASAACSTRTPRPGESPFDHHIYVIASDGDIEEGVTSEASSLAGHPAAGQPHGDLRRQQDLHRGRHHDRAVRGHRRSATRPTAGTCRSSRAARTSPASSRRWRRREAETDRPSFILLRTIIGFPAPNEDEHRQGARRRAGRRRGRRGQEGPRLRPGAVPSRSTTRCSRTPARSATAAARRTPGLAEARSTTGRAREPERKELLDRLLGRDAARGLGRRRCRSWDADPKGVATRKASGEVLKALADVLPELWGGSADLAESNNTTMEGADSFGPKLDRHEDVGRPPRTAARCTSASASTRWARSSTASRCTGRPAPTAARSCIFSDYMRPAVRLAALMKSPVDLRVDARLDRPRRGRPDPPADRAPGGAAGHPRAGRRPPRRRQRDRARLAGDPGAPGGPQGPRADPAEPARSLDGHLAPRASPAAATCSPRRPPASPQVILIATGSELQIAVEARDGPGGRRRPHPGGVDAVRRVVRRRRTRPTASRCCRRR